MNTKNNSIKNKNTIISNNKIKSKIVMLIDENNEPKGEVDIQTALAYAKELELDLIQISHNPDGLPVCKVMDTGKYKYQMQKKNAIIRKTQKKGSAIKEIVLKPKIEAHDLNVKVNAVKKFLANKDKVKVTIRIRKRDRKDKNALLDALKANIYALLEGEKYAIANEWQETGNIVSCMLKPTT